MNNTPPRFDKRKFERVPLVIDLYYRVQRPPEIRIKFGDHDEIATMVDISEGGIGFTCAAALPRNTELNLSFYLDSKNQGTIKIQAVGLIRFCSYVAERQVYRIGMVFTLIDEDDEKLIKAYVKGLHNPKSDFQKKMLE